MGKVRIVYNNSAWFDFKRMHHSFNGGYFIIDEDKREELLQIVSQEFEKYSHASPCGLYNKKDCTESCWELDVLGERVPIILSFINMESGYAVFSEHLPVMV